MELLGIIIKALDLDFTLSGIVVITLFSIALIKGGNTTVERVRRFLRADILVFTGAVMFAGNLSYEFYVEGADPYLTIAHIVVRYAYAILTILGFDYHIANNLWPDNMSVKKKFALIVAGNTVFVTVLVLMELAGWI